MALDYIIGGLQLLAMAVNVLALGAFWISPGLRATANRFVINLLLANIIACLALTPALWLNGGLKTRFHMDNTMAEATAEHIFDIQTEFRKTLNDRLIHHPLDASTTTTVRPLHHNYHHSHHRSHGGIVERDIDQAEYPVDSDQFTLNNPTGGGSGSSSNVQESIESVVIERDDRGNIRKFSEKQVVDIQRGSDGKDEIERIEIVEEVAAEPMASVNEHGIEIEPIATVKQSSTKAHRTHTVFTENSLIFDCTRFWGFDFAAAVGVLSVVLVVGDTWCAVTDPLRYHTRISYLKSWLLIASVWVVSIVITMISALRSKWCHIDLNLDNESFTNEEQMNGATSTITTTATFTGSNETMLVANIYALVFSCVFFTLIVLVPITVVCIMYYNIFSEARQSGLRMRRNGSSPLLQSSLQNLHNSSMNAVALNENQRYPSIFDVSAQDALTMKIDSQQCAIEDGKMCDYNKKSTPIATHHQYRRYLDIPEDVESQQHQQQTEQTLCKRQRTKSEANRLSGLKPKLSQIRRHLSARHLVSLEKTCDVPTFLAKNHNLGRMIAGEMRQVHSSPNLQKLSNLDILHKVPYCVNNNRSTSSINQTSQQTSAAPRAALSYMVSIRHRLSNASSIFKYREESRAARIGIVVVAMLMLSYLPYGLLILMQGRLTFIPNASLCSILFLLIANVTTPFIFAYRNRRVRRGVCRLFGVDPKSNSYLQKQRMQLRNGQNNNTNANKHVRIHRNLSASNFSLNMLPYKLATHSMLPIQNEQLHGNVPQSRHGSVLVPIDDVEIESNEIVPRENLQSNLNQKKIDENNNRLNKTNSIEASTTATTAITATTPKTQKEKMSLFQRIRNNNGSSRKSSISNMTKECAQEQKPEQCNGNNTETKDDAI